MTIRFRFSKSDMITTAGVAMRPVEITGSGGIFERVGQPGITETFSNDELSQLMRRPDTSYYPAYFDLAAQEARRGQPVHQINELPPKVRRLTLWRKAVCDAFLTLSAAGDINRTHDGFARGRAKLSEEVQRLLGETPETRRPAKPGTDIVTRQMPGSWTLFQWVRKYEKAGFSALALIPETHRSGNKAPRWCPRSEALMNQVIETYADTQRPTKTQAIKENRYAHHSRPSGARAYRPHLAFLRREASQVACGLCQERGRFPKEPRLPDGAGRQPQSRRGQSEQGTLSLRRPSAADRRQMPAVLQMVRRDLERDDFRVRSRPSGRLFDDRREANLSDEKGSPSVSPGFRHTDFKGKI
ncbi:hypothetical protein [Phaeovulum vinaykumarii]|uniref:hypothetical protein n=1 Tax=Phaeovulum vinaykumarii TaxID=407234 RepID=UPI00117A2331|nr:hypothetical protein [Phaeovulum vinaykumarii]